MFLPQVNANNNTTNYISQFFGLNKTYDVRDGEFVDMKNLSSDNFPLLSPRKKRQLALSVGKEEWETITTTWTERAEIEVSRAYGVYTASKTITGKDNYQLTFAFDDSVISHTELSIYQNGELSNKVSLLASPCEYYFLTEKDTTDLKIEIVAYAIDPEDFDDSQLSTYVTSETLKKQTAIIRGILCKNNKLAYLVGQKLYFDNTTVDFTAYFPESDDKASDLQLISFGAYILVFPVGLWFNTKDGSYGALGAKYEIENATVNYSICNMEGADYNPTVSATPPATPSDGDYWLDTANNGLYVWYSSLSMWQPISTTYIKISITSADFGNFSIGDAVFLNTKIADINDGSIIRTMGVDYIVVQGFMNKATDSETIDFVCERKIPLMDFVCVSNNRVWGCYSGYIDGSEAVNEIYASKLGDAKNWYVYDGVSTDSYALSLGDDGDFTGAITYQGYPMFFKENNIYKMYGNYPAAYQLVTYDCRGVQKNSEKSLCVLGELLMYKSIKDFCVWDGSTPTGVSEKLGNDIYTDAVAGVAMNKYYVSMRKGDEIVFMVYDISKGLWHVEDNLDIQQFAYNNSGALYGKNGLNIYGFGLATDDFNLSSEAEHHVLWSATLGKQYAQRSTEYNTYTSVERVRPGKTIIRADVPVHSELSVFVAYDDKPFEKVASIRGDEKSHEINFIPVRCDHYQIKFEGRDECKVYLIQTEYQVGSTR